MNTIDLKQRLYHIAICGNLGVGKSTLANILQKKIGGQTILEDPESYPFLQDAFNDPLRWSFSNQIQFLVSKIIDQNSISRMKGLVIQEMDIAAAHQIWTPLLEEMGFISPREAFVINQAYSLTRIANISIPQLYIVMKGDPEVIVGRIVSRNRDFEGRFSNISRLVNSLEQHVQEFVKSLKTPSINIDTGTLNILNANLDILVEEIFASITKNGS